MHTYSSSLLSRFSSLPFSIVTMSPTNSSSIRWVVDGDINVLASPCQRVFEPFSVPSSAWQVIFVGTRCFLQIPRYPIYATTSQESTTTSHVSNKHFCNQCQTSSFIKLFQEPRAWQVISVGTTHFLKIPRQCRDTMNLCGNKFFCRYQPGMYRTSNVVRSRYHSPEGAMVAADFPAAFF